METITITKGEKKVVIEIDVNSYFDQEGLHKEIANNFIQWDSYNIKSSHEGLNMMLGKYLRNTPIHLLSEYIQEFYIDNDLYELSKEELFLILDYEGVEEYGDGLITIHDYDTLLENLKDMAMDGIDELTDLQIGIYKYGIDKLKEELIDMYGMDVYYIGGKFILEIHK